MSKPTRQCKTCQAPIVWMPTKQGKSMPVDAHTVGDGDQVFDVTRGHISHFATCPQADDHRRERGSPSDPGPLVEAKRNLGLPDDFGK